MGPRSTFAAEALEPPVPLAEESDTDWWDSLCEETHARELEETPLPPISAPPGSIDGW